MSQAGAIRAGQAYVELYGEDDGLDASLSQADAKVQSFGQRIASTGAAIGASFGRGISTIVSVASAATAATLGLVGAGLAAVSFGSRTAQVATDTERITAALQQLTPVSTRTFTALSGGIFRGAGGIKLFSDLLQQMGPVGQSAAAAIDRVTASTASWLHRSSAVGRGAFAGGIFSRLIGDEQGAAFYTKVSRIADSARMADAFQQGPWRGLREALDVGVKRGLMLTLNGAARGLQVVSGGLIGLVGRSFRSVAAGVAGIELPASSGRPTVKLLDDIRAKAQIAANALGILKRGLFATVGLSGGLVGMFSMAAGLDLRTVGSRIMQTKSFATGAADLNKRGNAMISTADVATAKEMRGAMEGLFQAAEAAWAQIGAAVAPLVKQSLQATTEWVIGIARWINKNRELVASIMQVAMTIFKVATVAAIGAKVVGMLTPILVGLSNPVVALSAALAAGVAAWLYWSGAGGKVIEWLSGRFDDLLSDATTTWNGIVAAISSGDLALAGEIAWTGLKLAFYDVVKALDGNWSKFVSNLVETFRYIGDAWDTVMAGLATGGNRVMTNLAKGWAIAEDFFSGRMQLNLNTGTFTLSDQAKGELAALEENLQEANKPALSKRDQQINERRKKLDELLQTLPESDDTEIKKLRAKLNSLVKQAESQRGKPFEAVEIPKFDGAGAGPRIAGTFNAAAVQGLGMGSPLRDIATNTKKSETHLAEIKRKRAPALVFGGAAP